VNVKWIPNALSLARIFAAPIVAGLVYMGMTTGDRVAQGWAFGLFVVTALTDWLDGYLARRLDAKSALGGKLDLWGDKLLVGLTLVALWLGWLSLGNGAANMFEGLKNEPMRALIGFLLVLALPVRDFYITRLRARLEARDILVPPTFLAKSKTAIVMLGMTVILAGLAFDNASIMALGFCVLVIGAGLSIWTALGYLKADKV
jgi:cardiolipin synthase (CMP-forming)